MDSNNYSNHRDETAEQHHDIVPNEDDELDHMRELLREVIDPELGVNIVDLGLIYDVGLDDNKAYVRMTLTTPGCPMLDTIVGGVKYVLREYDDVEVEVVWSPPWHPEMITDEGKEQMYWF